MVIRRHPKAVQTIFKENKMIEGKSIYLRQMEESDMPYYYDMINDSYIYDRVVGWSFPVSMKEQNDWFEKAVKDNLNKRFTIVLKETNKPVGVVTLTNIDWQNRSAFHGIKLHSSCPKRAGIGTDAVLTLMKYAFNEVNLNRLDTTWLSDNIASENLYLKCGWEIEGIKKKAIFRNGTYHDLKITGITKEKYLSFINEKK